MLLDKLKALVDHYAISWTLFQSTIAALSRDFDETNCELAPIAPIRLQQIWQDLCDLRHWPFLTGDVSDSFVEPRVETLDL